MRKETVLAKIHVKMAFSEAVLFWFEEINDQNIWFAKHQGKAFFSEFRSKWEQILIDSIEPIIHDYFIELGIPEENLPRTKMYESYPGSWIMEAAIVMCASVGTSYMILKGVSEIPKIADGLSELKDRLRKEFLHKVSGEVNEQFKSTANQYKLLSPPSKPIYADLVLDARPLLSLTPSIMKSHKVHLNAAISRDAFTLENLGQDMMRDIRIGIFKSPSQRFQWSYADSYMGTIDMLSSQQTIAKDIADFRNSRGESLDISDGLPLHIDCWVQDSHGIYIFMFYLED